MKLTPNLEWRQNPEEDPMPRPSRIPVPFIGALAIGALLAGCGGAAPSGPEQEPREESAEGTPEPREPSPEQEPVNQDLACMIGEWTLDLADYAVQSQEYLTSLGIPLESIAFGGSHTLSFTEETFSAGWDMQTDAVVHGVPIATSFEAAGLGEWIPDSDGENRFTTSGWSYTVEPAVSDPTLEPPLIFDPAGSTPIIVGCVGDSLSIRADGAPLTGNFTRRG